MGKITVYRLVRHCLMDEEFQYGGISKHEEEYVDDIGLSREDENKLFSALDTIRRLHWKYNK